MSPSSGSKNKSRKKQAASRAIYLLRACVYVRNRRTLQDNSSVSIRSLREQSEPIGDKTQITSVALKRAASADWECEADRQ
jgi:hypothetical protein